MLGKLIAVAVHEIVTEYRKLDRPAAAAPPGDVMPSYDTASTLSASTERAPAWDYDTRPPVKAFGFGPAAPPGQPG